MNNQLEKRIIIIGFVVSFTGVVMNLFWEFINPPGVPSPMIYNVVMGFIMTTFSYIHSRRYFGMLKTNVLFIGTAVISLIMEHYGVVTGEIYGAYHYGTTHGPKIFGTVPVIIPLSWFMFLYPAVLITNELLSGETSLVVFLKKGGNVLSILLYAAIDSIIMTALDILIDPIWTRKGAWFWTEVNQLRPEEVFYQIPVQNYFGWLITAFIIFAIFRSVFFLHRKAYAEKDTLYPLPVYNYIGIAVIGTIQAWFVLKNPGLIFVSVMTLGFISLVSFHKMMQVNQVK